MAVMNVKRSTQSFSKAEQTSALKSEGGVNTASAQEYSKAYGDQSLGDVANKLSDPNWVDPSKKIRTTGNNEMGKDAFMKLMLAQMKNQDPTNPTPSHEMAAQLAQFTSLEQLSNINTTLEGMKDAQAPNSNYQALAFIGKKVSGDSAKLTRSAGDTKHGFSFDLMGDAAQVHVEVKDAANNVIKKLDVPNLKKGQNAIEWNGLDEQGMPARAGEYRFEVSAKSVAGTRVGAKTAFSGRITGLNYGSGGPILMVGDQSIKLTDVKKIEDVGPEESMPKMPLRAGGATPASMIPKIVAQAPQAKAEEEIAPAPEANEGMVPNNLDDIPMSQGLLNQISKEVQK
ncbi:MAG: flagellar hook assembly protein FlgD [Bdellovibrionota bacterium]